MPSPPRSEGTAPGRPHDYASRSASVVFHQRPTQRDGSGQYLGQVGDLSTGHHDPRHVGGVNLVRRSLGDHDAPSRVQYIAKARCRRSALIHAHRSHVDHVREDIDADPRAAPEAVSSQRGCRRGSPGRGPDLRASWGYEVFRFGHDELDDRDRARPVVADFFRQLLNRPPGDHSLKRVAWSRTRPRVQAVRGAGPQGGRPGPRRCALDVTVTGMRTSTLADAAWPCEGAALRR